MLNIPYIQNPLKADFSNINTILNEEAETILISNSNWAKTDYLPTVNVQLAHNREVLFLKYDVEEYYVRAVNTESNSPVWEDSCVELFVASNNKGYYNFEFNPIGTCFASYGCSKTDRILLSEDEICTITRVGSMGDVYFEEITELTNWSLLVAIPFTLMGLNNIKSGQALRANIYKCGNRLTKPHYLSYKKIEIDQPNFHRPDFFEDMILL